MEKQLLIIGLTGLHNEGLAKELTELLCKRGYSVGHASLRHAGTTTFATGGTADLKKELEAAGLPSASIQEGGAALAHAGAQTGGTGEVAGSRVTMDDLAEVLLVLDTKCDTIIAHVQKKDTAPKPPKPQGEKRGGRAEKVLPEVPKDAGLDEDGKPGVTGVVPEGAMRLPGNPVAEAPEGGWPAPDLPPTSAPPTVMEDTTDDDGDDSIPSAPAEKEEGEEG